MKFVIAIAVSWFTLVTQSAEAAKNFTCFNVQYDQSVPTVSFEDKDAFFIKKRSAKKFKLTRNDETVIAKLEFEEDEDSEGKTISLPSLTYSEDDRVWTSISLAAEKTDLHETEKGSFVFLFTLRQGDMAGTCAMSKSEFDALGGIFY